MQHPTGAWKLMDDQYRTCALVVKRQLTSQWSYGQMQMDAEKTALAIGTDIINTNDQMQPSGSSVVLLCDCQELDRPHSIKGVMKQTCEC